jgi:hypothetical protein
MHLARQAAPPGETRQCRPSRPPPHTSPEHGRRANVPLPPSPCERPWRVQDVTCAVAAARAAPAQRLPLHRRPPLPSVRCWAPAQQPHIQQLRDCCWGPTRLVPCAGAGSSPNGPRAHHAHGSWEATGRATAAGLLYQRWHAPRCGCCHFGGRHAAGCQRSGDSPSPRAPRPPRDPGNQPGDESLHHSMSGWDDRWVVLAASRWPGPARAGTGRQGSPRCSWPWRELQVRVSRAWLSRYTEHSADRMG